MARAEGSKGTSPAYPPLIGTQVRVPRHLGPFIARPRLVGRLGSAPVTLVCGPAGSGKTSLLSEWAQHATTPVGWLSLEPGDDDPFRLWRAVVESLRVCAPFAGPTLDAVNVPLSGAPEFAPLLVNTLAELPDTVTLVIDDVQLIRSRATREQLGFVLLHLPSTVRLILAARSDPVLPLHVLRVRTSLAEIRAQDLAFTYEECTDVLIAHGLDLDPADVDVLHTRTEGWAAGVRMAALTLQREDAPDEFLADFAGDDRVISDYLLAEVLDRLPVRDRAFLLRTAVADRLCGELADAITSASGGGADTLERLSDSTGFLVPIEGQRGWFRHHRLFGELLRARLRHHDPSATAAGHRRASEWYADHGHPLDALRHAVAGGDFAFAAHVLAGAWLGLFLSGERAFLRELLGKLPDELVARHADLSVAAACAYFDARAPRRAREHLAQATALGAEHLALAQLCAARYDGDLAAADAVDAEAPVALVQLCLGVSALWSFAFERAQQHLSQAAIAARISGVAYLQLDALAHLALARTLHHGPATAGEFVAQATAIPLQPHWARTPAIAAVTAAQAHIAAHEARPRAATLYWTEACDAGPEPHLELALDRLRALLDGTREPDGSDHPPCGAAIVEARVIEALTLYDRGETTAAVSAMELALEVAEDTGHRWAFATHHSTRPLLEHCIRAGTSHRALAGEALDIIENAAPAADGEPACEALLDPLTPRESLILEYLPTRSSNAEIAQALGVTTNTIKTHVRAVYRKLDAVDRRSAVARAQELRLLRRDR